MRWNKACGREHARTFPSDGRLSSLPEEWQREMAALWRVEADVNNGAYLQFFTNWGRESYEYASQALKKIGAKRMAEIVDACQALVDEHLDDSARSLEDLHDSFPPTVLDRIYKLSYESMNYPDNVEELGTRHYREHMYDDPID